ncbi:MAG: peptidoglycan-binding protein [Elusimicrobia bacterium]|nr:peptidoglycan-binding protein [Elusimicrobiota bacterium]
MPLWLAACAALAVAAPPASTSEADEAGKSALSSARSLSTEADGLGATSVVTHTNAPRILSGLESQLEAYSRGVPGPRAERSRALAGGVKELHEALLAGKGQADYPRSFAPRLREQADAVIRFLTPPAAEAERESLVPFAPPAPGPAVAGSGDRVQRLLFDPFGTRDALAPFVTVRDRSVLPAAPAVPALPPPVALGYGTKGPAVLQAQRDLNAWLWTTGRPRIGEDEKYFGGTRRAVAEFQRKHGIQPTGTLDAKTAGELRRVADEARRKLERPVSIQASRVTVYHPKAAKSKRAKRIEGPDHDRLMKPLCTADAFARRKCDAITVAIDQRLHVRYGTPVSSPQLTAAFLAECRVQGIPDCRAPAFALRDTGSCRYFNGANHIDVATESDHRSGFGKALNLEGVTLVFPSGLPPDFSLRNSCAR